MGDVAIVDKPLAPTSEKKRKSGSGASTKSDGASSQKLKKQKVEVDPEEEERTLASNPSRERHHLHVTPLESPTLAPVLACFPNAPPPLASLHNEAGGLAFGLWEQKGLLRTKKMLVAETDKMLYQGLPFARNPSKYFIMAVDRTTNKAKLLPVSGLYHMQQQLKGYTPSLPGDEDDDEDDPSFADQRRSLIERFGSRKRKTQVNSSLTNRIMTGSVSHADTIMTAIDEKVVLEGAPAVKNKRDLYPELPPFNAFTDVVQDIYPLGDILPFDSFGQIDPMPFVNAARSPDLLPAIAKKYGDYIAERVKELKGLLPGEQERLGRLLVLIGSLLKMRHYIVNKHGTFSPRDVKEQMGSALNDEQVQHFLQLFAEGEGRRYRSSTLGTTRATSYVLILLLHASEWRLNLALVTSLLEIDSKKCQQFLISIGCKRASSRGSRRASAAADADDADDAESKDASRDFALRAPLVLPDKTHVRKGKK